MEKSSCFLYKKGTINQGIEGDASKPSNRFSNSSSREVQSMRTNELSKILGERIIGGLQRCVRKRYKISLCFVVNFNYASSMEGN